MKQKFSNDGGGVFSLDTPIGGGQVLKSTDTFNDFKYGTRTVYEATPWSADNKIGEKKVFTSKSAAEQYARSMMGEKK